MNIEQYLFKISPDKIKLGLERPHELLSCCGNPEKSFFEVGQLHIALVSILAST